MKTLNNLQGNLQLSTGQSTGSVALLDAGNEVVSVAHVNDRGWFEFDAREGADTVFGVPGAVLSEAEMKAAVTAPPAIHYKAHVPAMPGEWVYVNGVSTIIASHPKVLKGSASGDSLKDQLFGKNASILLPGYPVEFLAHIGHPSSFSNAAFLKEADSAGGVARLVEKITAELNGDSPQAPRFTGIEAEVSQPITASGLTANVPEPDIPNSANWSSNDSKWSNTFNANSKSTGGSSKGLSSLTDGLSASINSLISGFSISDIGAMAAGKLKDKVVSFITAQAFGYLEEWIFGKKENPLEKALKEISEQLNTIIANQLAMTTMLSAVIEELKTMKQDALLNALMPPTSKIQSTLLVLYQQSNSGTAFKPAALKALTDEIVSPLHGFPNVLELMHNLIIASSGGTSLPKAVLDCCLKKLAVNGFDQNFLSNGNCYMKGQSMYQYFAEIQSQGVQLLMQAHNYQENANIKDFDKKMPSSAMAKQVFNTTMIGGSGSGGSKPKLAIQRDLYRSTFKPYYEDFEGYMGTLPDDIAVCLIPEVEGQVAPMFYNIETKFLVFGGISYTLRNWSAGKNVLAAQTACTKSNSWPFAAAIKSEFRFPSAEELKKIIGRAYDSSSYNGNYFNYLKDQGMANDFDNYKITGADNYGANVMVWVTDTQNVGDRDNWGWNNGGGGDPSFKNPYPPFQTNNTECRLNHKNPRYQWWYEGTVPKAMQLQNNGGSGKMNTRPFSSNGYDPNTNSATWSPAGMKFLDYTHINGGLMIIDAKKLA